MSKQRPDPTKMTNELAGASAFFRQSPPPVAEPVRTTPATPAVPLAATTPDLSQPGDVVTSRHHDVVTSSTAAVDPESVPFDITRETASRDSLRLSVDETKALDTLRASLKWDYDLVVSKNDICRVALHQLLEDFRARGERSQAVSRLKKKTSGR